MALLKSSLTARELLMVSTGTVIGGILGASIVRFFSRPGSAIDSLTARFFPTSDNADDDHAHGETLSLCITTETQNKRDPYDSAKREGYLTWDDYFMAIAFLSAQRSKDPNRQVGACLVSQNRVILGIGYNGFPRGCSDDDLPWAKKSITGDPLLTKYPYVCHAEVNAILNTNHASTTGQRLYVTMFPCNECAKIIIQSEIIVHGWSEGSEAPNSEF
ncbi:hypothetical protein SUGI_0175330 [Cryptomeria japonica]|nr:hypothetical protein SUGI_0175330 [Cryptomeria japonica]